MTFANIFGMNTDSPHNPASVMQSQVNSVYFIET